MQGCGWLHIRRITNMKKEKEALLEAANTG